MKKRMVTLGETFPCPHGCEHHRVPTQDPTGCGHYHSPTEWGHHENKHNSDYWQAISAAEQELADEYERNDHK